MRRALEWEASVVTSTGKKLCDIHPFQPPPKSGSSPLITWRATSPQMTWNLVHSSRKYFFLPGGWLQKYFDNTAAQGWANRSSISTATEVGLILQNLIIEARKHHIHASTGCVADKDKKMSDSASWMAHLSDCFNLFHLLTY